MGTDMGQLPRPDVAPSRLGTTLRSLLPPFALIVIVGSLAFAYWSGGAEVGPREVEATCVWGARAVSCDPEGTDAVRWRGPVRWVDSDNAWHRGRPGCLRGRNEVEVRLGVVDVQLEDESWTEVVWVDCGR